MHNDSHQDWRNLRLGDQIRFVRIPSLFDEAHYHNGEWDETFALYDELIAKQSVHPISLIDDDGRPWVDCELTGKDGSVDSHSLAVDDDSWELVSCGVVLKAVAVAGHQWIGNSVAEFGSFA